MTRWDPKSLDHNWQFLEPFAGVLLLILVEPLLQHVKDHNIGVLDLAISNGVCHQDVLDRDAPFVVEVLEIGAGERRCNTSGVSLA